MTETPKIIEKYISNNISLLNLEISYDIMIGYWEKYLKDKGVKKPPAFSRKGIPLVGGVEVAILSYGYPQTYVWNKTSVVSVLSRLGIATNDPQMVRHISTQYGFYVLQHDKLVDCGFASNGLYWLKTLEEPIPGFIPNRREGKYISLKGDTEICKTCFHRVGDENPRFGGKIKKIVQHHADPREPLTPYNKIWQCNICNRQFKDCFAWFSDGIPKDVLKDFHKSPKK